MQTSKLIAVETASPDFCLTQARALEFVKGLPNLKTMTRKWYERFLSDPGIETRYLGIKHLEQLFFENADETLLRFQTGAEELGSRALARALSRAGLDPHDLDGLIVATCTGYLCPGLTSYIAQKAGLRKNIYAVDLAGLGCGAAIPALRSGALYLQSNPTARVAVICVEICSAAMYWDDDVELILSNAIFADGAACAILSNDPQAAGLQLERFDSILLPEFRDELRFRSRNGRLCNAISPRVPEIASSAVRDLSTGYAEDFMSQLHFAAVHPAGRKVLDFLEQKNPMLGGRLDASRKILRQFGNMSSPSVLFVLKEILENQHLRDGDLGIMLSFGAGFTAFSLELKVSQGGSHALMNKERFHHEHTL